MSRAERHALLTLLGLIVVGHGVRWWLLRPGEAPGAVTVLEPAGEAALERQRAAASRAGRPLAPGERLDLNRATAADLDRLPRVGAGLARRIVAYRESHGPFRSLADLDRVPGVGAGILQEVRGWVLQGEGGTEGQTRPTGGAGPTASDGPEGSAMPTASTVPARRPAPVTPLDLNRATEAELLRLPGIGPAKARAIVAYRQTRGSFASVADLVRVPGIGPATLAGLAGLVAVR